MAEDKVLLKPEAVKLPTGDLVPVVCKMRTKGKQSKSKPSSIEETAPVQNGPHLKKPPKTGGVVKKRKPRKKVTVTSTTAEKHTDSTQQMDSEMTDSSTKECVEPVDLTDSLEDAYPEPVAKTSQQREKTQMARQRQLDEMRAREAAEAREKRLLKRKGLWKAPVPAEHKRKITWKDDLTAVFNYPQLTP